jgi:hypothetical protein
MAAVVELELTWIVFCAVDIVKQVVPDRWQSKPYFSKLEKLKGIPVINVHMCGPCSCHAVAFPRS